MTCIHRRPVPVYSNELVIKQAESAIIMITN